jgi:CubicO group peptidase (beta-lactamase class C family)
MTSRRQTLTWIQGAVLCATLPGALGLAAPAAQPAPGPQPAPAPRPAPPAQDAPASRPDESLDARADAYLKPYVDGGNFSGAILLARDGKPLVSRAYGMANWELGVANTPQTRFHIASVSKPFTAAAILLLEAQGRLHVSDPVARWIPDFPRGQGTTLLHLLTHTSGIADINGAPLYAAESVKPHTPLDLVGLIRGLEPAAAPGERYAYSNSNYNILAYVIELASGRAYGEFLRDAIFAPLGMADTGHDGNAQALIAGRAAGYVPEGLKGFGNAPWLDWSIKTGNGSLYSTTADLLKFDQALYGDRLLPKGSIDRILGAGQGNVFGWFVNDRLGHRCMAANGRSPGFVATLQRYIDEKITVIVLANTYSTAAQSPIAADLAALALGQKVATPPDLVPIPMEEPVLAAFDGTYAGGDDFFFPGTTLTVTHRAGYLMMHWSTQADSTLVPVAQNEFIDRSFWARVRFTRDADGRPSRLVWIYSDHDYPAARTSAAATP